MSDIVERLRDSVRACRAIDRSALLEEAAAEIERLRAENTKQAKQTAEAAYLLQGVPMNTPAFEAHRILCEEPPEAK